MRITEHDGECDNVERCHNMVELNEDDSALRAMCKECKHQYVIRKDWRGIPDNEEYGKLFKRWILQGHENLFYKYYSQHLKT